MKKIATLVAAATLVVLSSLALAPAASAATDPGKYPAVFTLDARPQQLYGGEQFTAFAGANVDCRFTLRWNGVTRTGSGTSYVTQFTAPRVTKTTVIPLTGTCDYADVTPRKGAALGVRAATLGPQTVNITVLPRSGAVAGPHAGQGGGGAGGLLPNTGGPQLALLVGGAVLVVAGGGAVVASRRRSPQE